MKHISLSGDDIRSCFLLFAVYFVCNAFEITNFNVSIDDEVIAYSRLYHFAEIGRWVHPIIRELFWPQVVVPFGPPIVFGLCIALSYLYVLRALGVERMEFFHYACFAAFVLFPVWEAQLEFAANAIALGVGVLSASIAALLTIRSSTGPGAIHPKSVAAAAALCSVAMGAYQSLVLVYLVLVVAASLSRYLAMNDRGTGALVRPIAASISILLLAGILYFLASKATLQVYGLQPSKYGQDLVNPGALVEAPFAVVKSFLGDVAGVYFVWWKDFGVAGYIFSAALVLGCLACLLAGGKKGARISLVALSLAAVVLLPASFVFVTGMSLSLRTLVAAPVSILCVLLLGYLCAGTGILRSLLVLAAMLVALQGLYVQSVYQARAWAVQRHDLLLASALAGEIFKVADVKGEGPIRIDVSGLKRPELVYPPVPTTGGGASFFEWDGGNPWRMVRYMNMLGFHRFVLIDAGERQRIASHYRSMPAWPRAGAVALVEGIVLVKLSE